MNIDKSNYFLAERVGTSLLVTFCRPEIRNPLSVAVVEGLRLLMDEAAADRTVARIVFAGSEGVFASGADLREIAEIDDKGAREFAERGQRLMNAIADARAVTVAAIDGPCYGGALDLALSCDRRVAATRSSFAHPGASLGIITGWGGTQRLPRLVGTPNALEMFFTASPITSSRAFAIGLIDQIADDPVAAALEVGDVA